MCMCVFSMWIMKTMITLKLHWKLSKTNTNNIYYNNI